MVSHLQTLRQYLAGEQLTIFADHNSLHFLFKVSELSGRLIRWLLRLFEFIFDIKYKKNINNFKADAFYWLRTETEAVNATAGLDIRMFDARDA